MSRGKSEQYLKDERALEDYLIATGLEEAVLRLPTGEERKFLHDGDEIILRAYFQREGAARIGLGECSGLIVASPRR